MGSMSLPVCRAKVKQGDVWRGWGPMARATAALKVAIRACVAVGEASHPYNALVMARERMALALVCKSSGSQDIRLVNWVAFWRRLVKVELVSLAVMFMWAHVGP